MNTTENTTTGAEITAAHKNGMTAYQISLIRDLGSREEMTAYRAELIQKCRVECAGECHVPRWMMEEIAAINLYLLISKNEHQESASVRRWSAIHALDFALFGGECVRDGVRAMNRPCHVADELRDAFHELFRHPSLSNAAKVYALRRNRAQSGDADVAFARLAAAYGIGSAPYLQPEAGAD